MWSINPTFMHISGTDENSNLKLRIPKYEKVLPKKIKEGTIPTLRMEFFETPLYIAKKKSKKTGVINGINYEKLVKQFILTGEAYYVQIIKRNNKYYVHITIDVEIPKLISVSNFGILGIDTNPDGLALTLISKDGNYSDCIHCSQCNQARNQLTEMKKKNPPVSRINK